MYTGDLPLTLTLTVSPAGLHDVQITASNGSYTALTSIQYSISEKDGSSGGQMISLHVLAKKQTGCYMQCVYIHVYE